MEIQIEEGYLYSREGAPVQAYQMVYPIGYEKYRNVCEFRVDSAQGGCIYATKYVDLAEEYGADIDEDSLEMTTLYYRGEEEEAEVDLDEIGISPVYEYAKEHVEELKGLYDKACASKEKEEYLRISDFAYAVVRFRYSEEGTRYLHAIERSEDGMHYLCEFYGFHGEKRCTLTYEREFPLERCQVDALLESYEKEQDNPYLFEEEDE